MTSQFDIFTIAPPDVLAAHWGWLVALGWSVAILGVVAIWKATTATLLSVRLLGTLILLGAIGVFFFSFTLAGFWTEFFVHVLWAAAFGIVGLIMLARPDAGAEAITLVIAAYFLVSGALSIGFAFSAHVDNLWIYVGEGLISATLGLILFIGWPVSGLWAIGTFIGVDLVLKGCAFVAMGLSLRAIAQG